MERRGQSERGGGRNADSHTHSSWVLLRDGEEEGVTCLQQEVRVCCPLRLQPFLLSQFKRALEQTEGFHRQSSTTYKMEKKPKTSHIDQECWVEGGKVYVKRIGRSKLFFQALC